jgi:hypothetical protein
MQTKIHFNTKDTTLAPHCVWCSAGEYAKRKKGSNVIGLFLGDLRVLCVKRAEKKAGK